MFKKSTAPSTGYNLTKSLRFRSSASAYLNRTAGTSTNQSIATWSFWFKRGTLGTTQRLFEGWTANSDTGNAEIEIESDNTLLIGGYSTNWLQTTQVFRDPSAWYHIVVAFDTTQSTASNRIKLYVNGIQVTSFTTAVYPSQNTTFGLNNNSSALQIGRRRINVVSDSFYDGYLTEVNFIDGQALTPSSFGSTNALTGVWQPAKYTGTYGTNGFYLPFTNTTSTATLGNDFSGNSNTWTVNNISLTAGSTYDSMTDVPTLTSTTASNYCTWNPLLFYSTTAPTVTNGNLTAGWNNTSMFCGSTMACISNGKTYAEFTLTTANTTRIGIKLASDQSQYNGGWTYVANLGTIRDTTDTTVQTVASSTNGDVIALAVDLNANTLQFYKNGSTLGTAVTIANASNWMFWVGQNGSGSAIQVDANFGQQPFAYTPPSGFVALNTYNLPTSTIVKGNTVMDATLYTGNGTTGQNIVNTAGFKPDFVWIKSRSLATNNALYDSIRGVYVQLQSNGTGAEGNYSPYGLTAFNSNGFGVYDQANGGYNVNGSTGSPTYVGWQWQAGQGSSSSNTNGSITSTVSVNATAGFSVVTYTGTGSGTPTVGHGLGVAPSMIIVKCRSSSTNWGVGHASVGWNQAGLLNLTNSFGSSSYFASTNPTSTVFSIQDTSVTNVSGGTMVAYCWAAIAGFSAFGSYTGNGSSDGPFIYTGFRPRFLMFKRSDADAHWLIIDTARSPYNQTNQVLLPDSSAAEASGSAYGAYDILSNGFKPRNVVANETNVSGGTYIYACFAENPFKNALAR